MTDFEQSLQDLLQKGIDHKIISRQELVYAACQVVRSVLHLLPDNEDRPRAAIETAERWCQGEVSLEEIRKAAREAFGAADLAAYVVAGAAISNVYYATASITDAVSRAAAAAASDVDDLLEKQEDMKTLLLSHLPRLKKLNVWI